MKRSMKCVFSYEGVDSIGGFVWEDIFDFFLKGMGGEVGKDVCY